MTRCSWANGSDLYQQYHDEEWGRPLFNDHRHFEFLTLESAQAGLSWSTILKKRENYRKAFADFNPVIVLLFDEVKVDELLLNKGIIRNKLKIISAINNAGKFLEIQKEFGSFTRYFWNFTNYQQVDNGFKSLSEIPAKTELSERISKDLKKRGFKFLGPVIIYSHLQAAGIVNDHLVSCSFYNKCKISKAEILKGVENSYE